MILFFQVSLAIIYHDSGNNISLIRKGLQGTQQENEDEVENTSFIYRT